MKMNLKSKVQPMKIIVSIIIAIVTAIAANSQVPVFSSYPGAQATVYLDFDGEYVQGTSWNWNGPIDAQPAALSAAQITEIFRRVSEDFGIFNLNITTDSNTFYAAPVNYRTRIIITPSSQWYGLAGGVSYVGSFTWGDDTPAWVFSNLLGNEIKKIAEAISHEAGHTLGLHHQSKFDANCNKTAEYYGGQGSGEIGWAPIMGIGYYKNLTTWYNGPNTMGCTSFQSDIDVIAGSPNDFGLRSDDHLDDHTGASDITIGMAFSAAGIINNASDRDVFKFTLYNSNNFRLSAIPQNVGSGNAGANVDIKVALLDQSADTIGKYNPADLLNVGVDTNLTSGTYYLVVDGVSNTNLSEYGSLGFYNLSASLLYALPVHRLTLNGRANARKHDLNWNFQADETVREIHIESSKNGTYFTYLASLPADSRSFSWQPIDNGVIYYRIKIIMAADQRAYYSNTLQLGQPASHTGIDVASHIIYDDIRLNVAKNFSYQLFDETGRLLQQGVLNKGNNRIPTFKVNTGLLFLVLRHKNEIFNERFIKR